MARSPKIVAKNDWVMRQKKFLTEEQVIEKIATEMKCSREEAAQHFEDFKKTNAGYSVPSGWLR